MSRSHIVAVNRPGDVGWIAPGSEQHTQMISPSKIPAILGFSRWESPYSTWMRMAGRVEADPPKDIYQVGHDVEPYLARRWQHLNPGWRLSPDEVQLVVDPDHFGFPALVTLDRRASRGSLRRVVQMKIARDLDDMRVWGDDLAGDGDCPPDYATQVFCEMLFSGYTQMNGHLMVAGPFWTEKCYPIEYDPTTAADLLMIIRAFWESLQSGTPPPIDDTVASYTTIRKLHPDIDTGAAVQLDPELATAYLQAVADQKSGETRLRGLKTRVLDAMSSAESAYVGTVPIAKRIPHASGSVALSANRNSGALSRLTIGGAA